MTDFGLKTNLSMKKVKLLILAALAVMISATSFAADADFPARPDTAIFVNDFAGVLRQSKVIDDLATMSPRCMPPNSATAGA